MSNFAYDVEKLLTALAPVVAQEAPLLREHHDGLLTLWQRLNLHRNAGDFAHRAECTKMLARLDEVRETLRKLWVHPTNDQLQRQIALLEAAKAPLTARLNGMWPEHRNDSEVEAETRLGKVLRLRQRQLLERAHSLQPV